VKYKEAKEEDLICSYAGDFDNLSILTLIPDYINGNNIVIEPKMYIDMVHYRKIGEYKLTFLL
jgi:hypothetical protein